MRILKYPLMSSTGTIRIKIPGLTLLSVVNQKESIVVYAQVPNYFDNKVTVSDLVVTTYEFLVLATGQVYEEDINEYKFLGTVLLCNGNLVWHVYYRMILEEGGE